MFSICMAGKIAVSQKPEGGRTVFACRDSPHGIFGKVLVRDGDAFLRLEVGPERPDIETCSRPRDPVYTKESECDNLRSPTNSQTAETNDDLTGVIPSYHRAATNPVASSTASTFCQRVQEAALKTQNYAKGFDRFVPKFTPKEEMEATMFVAPGCREDHGWAVYWTQGARRCLLLDIVDGLNHDETLWTALSAWASFQPRKANRRRNPGKLFYPTEASHVFEKYWDYLTCLEDHPEFASESQYCQVHMRKFSQALAVMRHKSWTPKSVAEAKQSDRHIAEDAALSRLRPIPDGPDQWVVRRSSADTGSGGPGAPLDSDNVPL
jgi:hypothetical protein